MRQMNLGKNHILITCCPSQVQINSRTNYHCNTNGQTAKPSIFPFALCN